MKKRVAILASGSGSNAEALLKAMQAPDYPAECVLVFSNRPGAGVLEKAARYGVPTAVLDHKAYPSRESFDAAVLEILAPAKPDYLCLAGYLRILTPAFIQAYAGRMLNIHPSLLPRHGGPGMYGRRVHEAVLASGDRQSGASVHWVTDVVDGGSIVLQRSVPVLEGDTPERLAERVLAVEHQLFPEALKKVCLG
jgi:phosphoribosylglycinamide formyltransferase-1